MRVLLTGAFGNVGLSTLKELLSKNYVVRVFEIKNRKNKSIARRFRKKVELFWGDIRNEDDVLKAVDNCDIIIHLAAIIPPLADANHKLAENVNIGGTINVINAVKKHNNNPKLIFTSSIAVYGDRRNDPIIKVTDPLSPSKGDFYALTKISAEKIIRESGVKFTIFRLTYITSVDKIDMDPLMFHMPLDTYIEVCDTKDVGFALVEACASDKVWGKTFNIAGGKNCRTTYREYLSDMMEIFGLGRNFLPDQAYTNNDFHCGYMDTSNSQQILEYQHHSLNDYYSEVKKKVAPKRIFMPIVKGLVRLHLLNRSEPYRRFKFFKRKSGAFTVSENKFIRKIISNNFDRIESLEMKMKKLQESLDSIVQHQQITIQEKDI